MADLERRCAIVEMDSLGFSRAGRGDVCVKLRDFVDAVSVNPRKLTHYALEPSSPIGKHKAALFERLLGYTRQNAADLIEQIETMALNGEATALNEDECGRRYRVDRPINGVQNQEARVRTGWLVPPGSRTAHLVSIYVKKR